MVKREVQYMSSFVHIVRPVPPPPPPGVLRKGRNIGLRKELNRNQKIVLQPQTVQNRTKKICPFASV
jgi:hypothetical protein